MNEINIEVPLKEVRQWKLKVSKQTRKMSPGEVVRYFREGAEGIWRQYGYRCVSISTRACKHVHQRKKENRSE